MFFKELKDTLRQTGFIMAFFILVPVLYLIDHTFYNTGMNFSEYISNGLDLFILITAMYVGYNMFKAEEEDGAKEYLLSLPVSRWSLFLNKLTPRVIVLIPLLVSGMLVYEFAETNGVAFGFFLNWFLGFNNLIFLLIFIQICGFILGLVGWESWITRLMLLVMVVCIWQYSSIALVFENILRSIIGWRKMIELGFGWYSSTNAYIDGIFNYALLAYILVPLLGMWDLKPIRVREVWFQKRAFLPMIVFSLLLVSRYLTKSFWWWW